MDHPLAPVPGITTTPPATPRSQRRDPATPHSVPTIVEPPSAFSTATPSPSRSPRLGQASFDASIAETADVPPYTARPRQLFASIRDLESRYPPASPTSRSASDYKWTAGAEIARNSGGSDDFDGMSSPSSLSGHKLGYSTPMARVPDAAATIPVQNKQPSEPAVPATFRTLFSLTSRSTLLGVVLPGTACAIGSGLIPPYMTTLLGDALQAFTDYGLATGIEDLTPEALGDARSTLLSTIKSQSIKFFVLGAVVLAASASNVALWVVHGERVARELRLHVYKGVTAKGLDWYETGMGGDAEGDQDGATSAVDAAGLTGRFSKDTDDVRVGSAQTVGLVLQYLSSSLFCIILAFWKNWRLAFVVLATIPIVVVVVSLTERWSGPMANRNRATTAECTSRVNRIVSAIATVKAFNAEQYEQKAFKTLTHADWAAYTRLHLVWGLRSGFTQFLLMAMFVQGFWYGAHLISTGQSTPASVNTAFWACLLGSSYLQTCIPSLVALEKAKIAMAGLLQLARPEPARGAPLTTPAIAVASKKSSRRRKSGRRQDSIAGTISWPIPADEKAEVDSPIEPYLPTSTVFKVQTSAFVPLAGVTVKHDRQHAPRALRKLRPATFSGELSLRNVTFHYPARPAPAPPALDNVSLYFAARETTFVVGTSGSGKSTVGSLLLGLYHVDDGRVEVDEQGLEWIDEEWLRAHVACVSQGASVLLEGTVHENIAIGAVGQLREDGTKRSAADVTREEVIAACRAALLHDFIRDLPQGYDTPLSGERGASLSGGQRQRLAIARAYIRDPTVLILDEATSALDATSRVLVNEAVKRWRDNRTTIVITHDFTPIAPHDFVYVMAEGRVVQQGFREDLEAAGTGKFLEIVHAQGGGDAGHAETPVDLEAVEELVGSETALSNALAPVIDDAESRRASRRLSAMSLLFPPAADDVVSAGRQLWSSKRSSTASASPSHASASFGTSYLQPPEQLGHPVEGVSDPKRGSYQASLSALAMAGQRALQSRVDGRRTAGPRRASHGLATTGQGFVVEDGDKSSSRVARRTVYQLARRYWRTIPNKMLFLAGMVFSIMVGACTPLFSSYLSKVISNLGNPNAKSIITQSAIIVLGLAVVDGSCSFLKFYCMERCAMGWITSLRRQALEKVVQQGKAFFDGPENTTSAISYSIIKDSEDARTLVGTIIAQLTLLASMLTIGITWSLVTGWELTLVGFGMAPVIIVVTRSLASVLNRLEAHNKDKREEISKHLMQTLSNVKAIRSMSIQPIFDETYHTCVGTTYAGGIKAAPFAGLGLASTFALTYVSQGVMLLVGAILVAHGRYTFTKMLQVFSLIIFTVTFAGQLMNYLPAMAKSLQAADDLLRLLDLPDDTHESKGELVYPVAGRVDFDRVDFSYPSRPTVPILRGVTFNVNAGECVAVVGSSGSGKSTVAALLQRLYEPTAGRVLLDGRPLSETKTSFLRDHTAVVSQHPALFDMSIAENIAYGREDVDLSDIKAAARAAHIDDFIEALPLGYETKLGDNASFVSGGQAQRLQMARALLQPRELLILDECTSALDPTNQKLVLETIMRIKEGRTTLIVTHKLAVMEQCDRLLVMSEGEVAEAGTMAELLAKPNGVFASLASGGEWELS